MEVEKVVLDTLRSNPLEGGKSIPHEINQSRLRNLTIKVHEHIL